MTSEQDLRMRLTGVVKNAIGTEDDYALGYLNPLGKNPPFDSQGTGYIATMKLSVGKVNVAGLDEGTENIVSYDRCEAADANIAQINMETASSFCGLNGALWGYHVARVNGGKREPLFTIPAADDPRIPTDLAVYPATDLLGATEKLFGHVEAKDVRHPPMPGAHVICANKSATVRGPAYAWAIIAIAIAKQPTGGPERFSNLFIEDCGTFPVQLHQARKLGADTRIPNKEQVKELLEDRIKVVAKSIALCGQDYHGAGYEAAYISAKAIYAGPDEVGCALACAPYVLLSPKDVPKDVSEAGPERLIDITLDSWEQEVWGKRLTPSFAHLEPDVIMVPDPGTVR
ncbi:histidine decarboxylase, pyruvoyl type [Streptomyces sp. NPDC002536]